MTNQTKGRKKQPVSKKIPINKKPKGCVIWLDPAMLKYPERVKAEENKILEETAKTENKSKLKDLCQFKEDIAISAADFDDILHDKFITEKENEKHFNDLIIGKRVGVKITDSDLQSKRGTEGGKKSKTNKPILIAVTQYLKDNPKLKSKSNQQIAESFKRNVSNEDDPIIVNFSDCEWYVYFTDKFIWAVPDTKNITKHKETSRAFETLRKTYIPKAKEELIKETQK